ncbi:hypothetical protein EVAR_40962_1 [Eumeta japonica]|uniref:Uncharacterized protein n=1 Tax=Eumeta variegata TaxID=151549 RepID=A0A4C1X676_EUMVA|nr:hypothetical protein EVAR_40962_1 [Eumeta japonica]
MNAESRYRSLATRSPQRGRNCVTCVGPRSQLTSQPASYFPALMIQERAGDELRNLVAKIRIAARRGGRDTPMDLWNRRMSGRARGDGDGACELRTINLAKDVNQLKANICKKGGANERATTVGTHRRPWTLVTPVESPRRHRPLGIYRNRAFDGEENEPPKFLLNGRNEKAEGIITSRTYLSVYQSRWWNRPIYVLQPS